MKLEGLVCAARHGRLMKALSEMTTTTRLSSTLSSAVRGYLLEALGADGTYNLVDIDRLPKGVLVVPERDLLLAATPSWRADYRNALKWVAIDQRADILLLRIGRSDEGLVAVKADLALCASPGHWIEHDMRLWAGDSGRWLVPHGFGPSISISSAGLTLELIAPYETLEQRDEGIWRASQEMTQIADRIGAR